MSKFNRPLYRSWHNMMTRCYKPNRTDSKWYYDKGVRVDDSWHSFDTFREDMEESWRQGLWLEREDPDKDYSADNCIWATPSRQQINRKVRDTNPTNHKGVFLRKENGKYRTGVMINDKWKWLGTFESLHEAVNVRTRAEEEHYATT